MPKLTLMEEVLLLGLKDKQVRFVVFALRWCGLALVRWSREGRTAARGDGTAEVQDTRGRRLTPLTSGSRGVLAYGNVVDSITAIAKTERAAGAKVLIEARAWLLSVLRNKAVGRSRSFRRTLVVGTSRDVLTPTVKSEALELPPRARGAPDKAYRRRGPCCGRAQRRAQTGRLASEQERNGSVTPLACSAAVVSSTPVAELGGVRTTSSGLELLSAADRCWARSF